MRQNDRFQSGQEERLNLAPDSRSNGYEQLRRAERHEFQVEEMLSRLNEREGEIIRRRYGLGGRPRGLTLEQAGDGFGVSKERVRQIEIKALAKLRETAESERIEM